MKKHYVIMGAFALDYFMEEIHPEFDMHDEVSLLVMENAVEISNKIAEVIELKCESDREKEKEIQDLFLGDIADYFYHYMFLQDVTGLDEEVENFIKTSYDVAGETAIYNIVQAILEENGLAICTLLK